MSVIPLTLFFSLLLAGLFIALFAHEQRRRRFASTERDSLLPLAEEQSHVITKDVLAAHSHAHEDDVPPDGHGPDHGDLAHPHGHDHHHDHDKDCNCRTGKRLPCAGCLKHLARTAPASPLTSTHSS